MQQLIESADQIREQIKAAVRECLVKINQAVEFDWDEGQAPSYCSGEFQDDVTDAYITKIWLQNGLIMVNLHAYYLGEDVENVDLNDDVNVDWEDILYCLMQELED